MENAMTRELIRHNRAISDHLHPLVYKAMAGLALWFAFSAWVFFGEESYTALALAVVSLFLLILVAIPFTIWMTWRGSIADATGR
jgi:ABC-type proline/glycine betaine transport system permease subunit